MAETTDPAASAAEQLPPFYVSDDYETDVPRVQAVGIIRAAYRPLLRQAAAALELIAPNCEAICEDGDGVYACPNKADARAEWSDREMFVCHEHHDYARDACDGDNCGDRDKIAWSDVIGGKESDTALADLRAALGAKE